MDIIKSTHNVESFNYELASYYLPGKTIGVFDIETLGLNGDYCPMILAGLMMVDDLGNATITQFFADDPDDEEELLRSLYDYICRCDYLLTYNGRHFDIPFISKRSKKHGLPPFLFPYNLDLYQFLRSQDHIKEILPDLKQKTVEKYMGIGNTRDDLISGAQSVELYYKFINAGSNVEKKRIKKQILLHNHDDVLQLYKLMPILKSIDLHKGFFNNGFAVRGRNRWPSMEVKKISVSSNSLTFSGVCLSRDPFEYANFFSQAHPFECSFKEDLSFFFNVPTKKISKSVYVDLTDLFDRETISGAFDFAPECVNSFLILKDEGTVSHSAVNRLVMNLISSFMMEALFPG